MQRANIAEVRDFMMSRKVVSGTAGTIGGATGKRAFAESDELVIRGKISWADGMVGVLEKNRNPWKNHRHWQLFLQK